MTTARDLLRARAQEVASLPPDATVLDAAQCMNERHIGSILVVDEGTVVGIFTERDVLRRIVAAERSPRMTRVDAVMTAPVAAATPDTTLDELRAVMRQQRIRHVPVIDNGKVCGMISIGDLNQVERDDQSRTIAYLEQYISVS